MSAPGRRATRQPAQLCAIVAYAEKPADYALRTRPMSIDTMADINAVQSPPQNPAIRFRLMSRHSGASEAVANDPMRTWEPAHFCEQLAAGRQSVPTYPTTTIQADRAIVPETLARGAATASSYWRTRGLIFSRSCW